MSQQTINLGTADSGNGDPLRVAFDKVNDNFTELYSSSISTASTSASPPLLPGEGDLWWNTNDGNLYVYYLGSWISSNTAGQGPQGPQGAQGAQGPRGLKGDKGDTGANGIDGAQGIQGIQGEQGPRGLKGDKGDTGADGLKGDKGDTGEQGAQGPRGLKGDKGDTGADGLNGEPGIQGEVGEQGPRGLKGDKGDTGADGLKGDKGDKGDTGEQGLRGLKGDTGEQGLQGLKGDTGEAGPQGDRGFPGTQVQFSLTAPNPIAEGNVWWNMNDGNLYVHYNNQWVSAVSITGINSTDRLVNGDSELVLDEMGFLTVPSSIVLSEGVITFMGEADPGIVLGSSINSVFVRTLNGVDQYEWKFGTNGQLTLPADGVINSDDSLHVYIFDSDVATLESTYNDKVLELDAAFATESWTGAGYPAGPTSAQALNLAKALNPLIPDEWITIANELKTAYDAWQAALNGKHWTFDTNGGLTLPGSLKVSNAPEGSIIGEGGVSINAKNGYQFSAAYQRAEILNPTPGYNANVAGFYLDGNGATIEINTDDTGNSWTFDTTGNLTFPNNTVQTTAWTGTTAPAHSFGAAGDRAGMVAFDSTYIYYCFADFNPETSFVTTSKGGDITSGNITTNVPWGDLPAYVQIGWKINVSGFGNTWTITSIGNNNGFTNLSGDNGVLDGSEAGRTITLSNPGDIAIWKRTAHGTGTW